MLIQVEGARLFALEAGQGEPALVFIHGNGADHSVWHCQIAYFSPLTWVVAIDLRGHGQSGPDPSGAYQQETLVEDLHLALNSLCIKKSILVGWSMGGSVAARFAVEYPSLTAGLVLVDNNLQSARSRLGVDPRLTEDALRHLAEDFAGRGIRSFVDPWFPETEPEVKLLREWMYDLCRKTSREVVYAIRCLGAREDRRSWLERLNVPTLILQGGACPLGGRAMGEYLAGLIKGARLQVLEGKGHAPFLTAPGQFNFALEDFLLQVSGGNKGLGG